MKNVREIIKSHRLFFDGGTGTVLQKMGLPMGEAPELWNITNPEKIVDLHKAYLKAGANIIKTNTFGINPLKYENYAELIRAALNNAFEARRDFPDALVAYDMGPLGRLLEPLGELPFESAVEAFSSCFALASECDLILIETFNDSYETKAAVLAAKESTSLPIIVTNAYDESEKLMTGASPEAMVALLEGLDVDAIGCNCSFGPDKMLPIAKRLLSVSSLPIVMNPNAGLPSVIDGNTVYDITKEEFASYMLELSGMGVTVLGGCCGTDPSYISDVVSAIKNTPVVLNTEKNICTVSSYSKAVTIGQDPILIGERINPTGKPTLKAALREGNLSYLLNEAIRQEEAGAHILDVNVGLPDIDELSVMTAAVKEIQTVTDLPLQIDSSSPSVLEGAMRIYNGKPLINSVNGEREKLDLVLPLVKKYGGVLVVLTMDENGLPDTAEGRVEIALKIASEAARYGIKKSDLIIDPLTLSASADKNSAGITLSALKKLTKLGFRTVLGVSNISFGLPKRENINMTFFAEALANGLSCAIMNPFSEGMTDVYYSFRALAGYDQGCVDYISYADKVKEEKTVSKTDLTLRYCITKGMTAEALKLAREIKNDPMSVIDNEIIPALNEVGTAFEKQKVYLPQLLMSADAASAVFNELKKLMPNIGSDASRSVILATVKGDIHDIGKNIVRVLLESYGFNVIDLGRDVPPDVIVKKACESSCKLVGLSALMTTTVPSMEETIMLLRKADKDIKVMVGGAVLTPEYAEKIGADFYSPDAMGAVRYAERIYSEV